MDEKKEQTKRDIRDALFIDCPIRNVLARVGDKWSLTQTLRTLKEDGFISRDIINMRMIKMCILYNISLKVGYFEINGVSLHKNIYKQNTTCRYY